MLLGHAPRRVTAPRAVGSRCSRAGSKLSNMVSSYVLTDRRHRPRDSYDALNSNHLQCRLQLPSKVVMAMVYQ